MDTSIFKYGELPEFKKFTPENISKQFPVVLEKISKDFKNIEDIQRILKYIEKGKLDIESWSNIEELKNSLKLLIEEHKDYMDHMKLHH